VSVRIFILEDHSLMRDVLVEFLSLEPDWLVTGVARSGEDALVELEALPAAPSIVLVDVSLPGITGIEFVRRYARTERRAPCVMLSGHHDASYVRQALAAGAAGYVLKGNPAELLRTIDAVVRGEQHTSAPA
jgi:DNA-binding NarL/FixJ family response regulator